MNVQSQAIAWRRLVSLDGDKQSSLRHAVERKLSTIPLSPCFQLGDFAICQTIPLFDFRKTLRENFRVDDGEKTLKDFFEHLPNDKFVDIGPRRICGVTLHVYGGKTKSGDLVILGSRCIHGEAAADMYLQRWNIETGFKQLKTAGFDLESVQTILLFALARAR